MPSFRRLHLKHAFGLPRLFKQAETVTRDEPVLIQKVFLYNQLNGAITLNLGLFFLHWAEITTHYIGCLNKLLLH